jgi:PAS domain S-box-containing protein
MEPIIIQSIMQSIPMGIIVINSKGEIVLCNPSASAILGIDSEDVLGKGWGDLFLDNKDNVLFNQILIDVIWNESPYLHRNVPYIRAPGEIRQLSITSSFIKQNGAVVGIVILFDDITTIHEMHVREKQWLEEKKRLEKEKGESLFRLSLAVADQLRNPAVAIGGFARRILKQTGENTVFCANLRRIIEASQRLEHIVKVFAEFLDSIPISPKFLPVIQLVDQIRVTFNELAQTLPKLTLEISAQPVTIFADPHLINQALLEILQNSLENGNGEYLTICINIYQEKGYCVIEISDNGPGIPEKDMPFIFNPFFTTKSSGIGMGLCKAQKIITHLGGSLAIKNMQDHGTNTKITLPLR